MTELFYVVVNHDEHYSVWPARLDLPAGWSAVGEPATREECLRRSEERPSPRPRSLRLAMATDTAVERAGTAAEEGTGGSP